MTKRRKWQRCSLQEDCSNARMNTLKSASYTIVQLSCKPKQKWREKRTSSLSRWAVMGSHLGAILWSRSSMGAMRFKSNLLVHKMGHAQGFATNAEAKISAWWELVSSTASHEIVALVDEDGEQESTLTGTRIDINQRNNNKSRKKGKKVTKVVRAPSIATTYRAMVWGSTIPDGLSGRKGGIKVFQGYCGGAFMIERRGLVLIFYGYH